VDDRVLVTPTRGEVATADRIVLAGRRASPTAVPASMACRAWSTPLQREVIERAKPFLGICVGMQLMATHGVEYGIHAGLDWIAGDVVRIDPGKDHLKIPHMGWNELLELQAACPARRREARDHAYFVHSLSSSRPRTPEPCSPPPTMAGRSRRDRARQSSSGTQFHPERARRPAAPDRNFLRWKP